MCQALYQVLRTQRHEPKAEEIINLEIDTNNGLRVYAVYVSIPKSTPKELPREIGRGFTEEIFSKVLEKCLIKKVSR